MQLKFSVSKLVKVLCECPPLKELFYNFRKNLEVRPRNQTAEKLVLKNNYRNCFHFTGFINFRIPIGHFHLRAQD